MQKRGGGRFGKYGDLKRKEKIRQTRLLKHDGGIKQKSQWPVFSGLKKRRLFKPGVDVEPLMRKTPGLDEKCKQGNDGR